MSYSGKESTQAPRKGEKGRGRDIFPTSIKEERLD